MTRTEWLAERERGIGGSEAAAILGMNPYMSNVELWEYKTGRRQREEKDSPYMEYGREAERALVELFGLDYPRYKTSIHEAYRLERNEEYPFMLGTVDAGLEEKETNKRGQRRKGFLEVKTTNILASGQKEQWNERIPQNYYVQCLHYLLVNPEYEYFYLKAQLKSVWKHQGCKDQGDKCEGHKGEEVRLTTKHYYYERKEVEEDLKILKEKEIEFWGYVKKGEKPNMVLPPI
jgi:putative phage-type endonuclease